MLIISNMSWCVAWCKLTGSCRALEISHQAAHCAELTNFVPCHAVAEVNTLQYIIAH